MRIAALLVAHHVLSLEHLLHELLLLEHLLEVSLVYLLQLLLHHLLGHPHRCLSGLEDGLLTPESVHGEDLGVGLVRGGLHVGVEAYHGRLGLGRGHGQDRLVGRGRRDLRRLAVD